MIEPDVDITGISCLRAQLPVNGSPQVVLLRNLYFEVEHDLSFCPGCASTASVAIRRGYDAVLPRVVGTATPRDKVTGKLFVSISSEMRTFLEGCAPHLSAEQQSSVQISGPLSLGDAVQKKGAVFTTYNAQNMSVCQP